MHLINQEGTYLKIPYFSSEMCVSSGDMSGCTNDFNLSLVKQILDVWSMSQLKQEDLVLDSLGYKVRLITYDEYIEKCKDVEYITPSSSYIKTVPLYEWMFNRNHTYWTMTLTEDSSSGLYSISENGSLFPNFVGEKGSVRPVITLKKSNYNNHSESLFDKNDNQIVKVPDTLLQQPIIFVVLGVILIAIGTTLFILFKNKRFTKNK